MITQVSFPHGPGGSPPGRGGGKEHGGEEEVKKRDKRAWWHIKESFNININHQKATTLTEEFDSSQVFAALLAELHE